MKVVIIATIIGTIFITYLLYVHTGANIRHVTCPDKTRFYNSLSPQNRLLRPSARIYYDADDTRIPERLRRPAVIAFEKATHDFPLIFSKTQPVLQFASGDTEGGMPHTLGNRVIFPLRESLATDSPRKLWTTMIHELCHVHQRQHPDDWMSLYEQLGFVHISPQDVPDLLRGDNVVANPDAGYAGMPQIGWWSYKGQVGALVFTSSPATIRDHTSVVFPVTPDGASVGTNQLREAFGGLCGQYDHPNEITACIISDHWDNVVKPSATTHTQDPRTIIRRWIQKSILNNQ